MISLIIALNFFSVNGAHVDLNDTYRMTFNTTLQQCALDCLYDIRCFGYFYEFSNPRNAGCYLKGDPDNFEISMQRLRPSTLGIKVRPWKQQ